MPTPTMLGHSPPPQERQWKQPTTLLPRCTPHPPEKGSGCSDPPCSASPLAPEKGGSSSSPPCSALPLTPRKAAAAACCALPRPATHPSPPRKVVVAVACHTPPHHSPSQKAAAAVVHHALPHCSSPSPRKATEAAYCFPAVGLGCSPLCCGQSWGVPMGRKGACALGMDHPCYATAQKTHRAGS